MIRQLPTTAITFLLTFLLAFLPACKAPPTDTGSGDRGVSAIQFQDIVVPTGLKLQEGNHESHSVEESGWRFGHFVYTGQPRVDETSAYVLERMPQHAWSLAGDEAPDASTRRLKFVRGRYLADYTIQRVEGVTHMIVDYRTQVSSR
jgi:hypothetical protein